MIRRVSKLYWTRARQAPAPATAQTPLRTHGRLDIRGGGALGTGRSSAFAMRESRSFQIAPSRTK